MIDNFPYTNFHELNLDWILKAVKECVAKVEAGEETIEEAIEEVEALIDSIDSRFEDVEVEIAAVDSEVDALDARVESVEDALPAKLDKKETTGEFVYGHLNTQQREYILSSDSNTPNAVPVRDMYGRLKGPEPANNTDLVNKAYADTKVAQKTSGGLEVYAHNNLAQTHIGVGTSASQLPQRNDHANITIATSAIQDATDAVNKQYVDGKADSGIIYDMLTGIEDMDESYTFSAPGTWDRYAEGQYFTRIAMDDDVSITFANIILVGIDGEALKFSRCSSVGDQGKYYYLGPEGYSLVAITRNAGDIYLVDLIKDAAAAPATSTISTVGFSVGYAPVADLALKSEAQELIFVLDDDSVVTKKVVMVDD